MAKKKVYPLCLEEWAECGYYSFGHHEKQDFIIAIGQYLDEEVESIEGFVQEYGYNVPSSHFSEYRTMWYTCDGPQKGARPLTQCYDVKIKPRDVIRYETEPMGKGRKKEVTE